MATPKQRAARKRRRQAKAARARGQNPQRMQSQNPKKSVFMGPKKGPIYKNPQRVNHPFSSKMGMNTRKGIIGEVYSMPYREECLGAVSTATTFAVSNQLVLNAGNSITFPWLGSIAPKFEYYRFKKLALRFESSSGYSVASTNTALGTMLVNCNYDVLDTAFASQIEMEAYGGGKKVSEKEPNITFTHNCEPNGIRGGVQGGWRYVLASTATSASGQPYPSQSSAHDYDIGLLQVASAGAQAASVAGRLYMCYEVEFANPKLAPGAPVGAAVHFSSIVATTADNFAGAVQQSGGTLGGVTVASNVVTFPANVAGNYLLQLNIQGATSASAPAAWVPSAGASALNVQSSGAVRDTTSNVQSLAGTTTSAATWTKTVTIAGTGGIVTLTPSTIVGTGTMDLWIFAMPSTLLTVDEREQEEIDELKEQHTLLQAQYELQNSRLSRLESMLVGSSSIPAIQRIRAESSEEESPDESKESEVLLEKSVHIPRSVFNRFMSK